MARSKRDEKYGTVPLQFRVTRDEADRFDRLYSRWGLAETLPRIAVFRELLKRAENGPEKKSQKKTRILG